MGNIVAIVGRPNVGKSTLFNRLTESRDAIVDEMSGVTRDRHYGKAIWNGKEFSVIDTGGYVTNSDDIFEDEIRKQVHIAIKECDIILFLVDVFSGVTDLDDEVAQILRKTKKPVILGVNKVDTPERQYDAQEFYKFGLGEIHCISSANGSGTGDLLDAVVSSFVKNTKEDIVDIPKYAIIGRPNVGKSSLLNALIGEERHIVTPISGTTRDSIYTRYNKYNHDFYLVDTAGIRKKGKVHEDLEFYSVLRSIRAIESSDVCLLLIDATRGVESQDMAILDVVRKNNKGVVILVNKWDLVEKENNTARDYTKVIQERIAPFKDIPILFTSALTKQRIHKVLETAIEVFQNRTQKIPTHKLNELMLKVIEDNPPPATKGKYIRIKYVSQLPTHSPTFAFFCNLPQYVKDPYKRFLENKLRESFNFTGVPIRIFMRKK
ncbi:MAG: ribosome biogenesis GTPase Der [Bacteroidales bacterium]|nr:ribosome biogenesis GTPase Der [Bacteroidales bacterium]MBN2819201.1 ribosome biogenesis GTPase Der [Bacteroidales bacterium]